MKKKGGVCFGNHRVTSIFAADNENKLTPDTEVVLGYLAQKDDRAFRYLYGVYFVALKTLAGYYVKDEQVAADLVQEVFISLWESTHRFVSMEEVKYFLYSALRNKCVSHFRKQKVRERYQQEMLSGGHPVEDFWEKALEEDVYAELMAAIEKLPPQCQLVMKLSLEGLKVAEIAERLHISEETVKDHRKNGKRKLAELLENPFVLFLIASL